MLCGLFGVNSMSPDLVIEYPLWKKAQWRDVVFLFQAGTSPGIGLAFEDMDSGKRIFSSWRAKVGDEDTKDIIRVSLVDGSHPSRGKGYSLVVAANAEVVDVGTSIVPVLQVFKATDGHNFMLERFKAEFSRVGAYWMIPIPSVVTGSLDALFSFAVIKRSLHFKDFATITESDQEYAALR
jgi:hypothetical protein